MAVLQNQIVIVIVIVIKRQTTTTYLEAIVLFLNTNAESWISN